MSEVYDYSPYFRCPVKLSELRVLLTAYRDYERLSASGPEYPSKASIFRKIAELQWGPHNKRKQFVWNPWAEKMNEVCHQHPITGKAHPHTALSGCAASGKSSYGAIYGIINWESDPVNTLVLCTSTDLKASRQRIWGQVKEYYNAVPGLMGKMVDSQGIIVTVDKNGNKVSDRCGVALVAGEKKKEADALAKIIGAHNKRVIMIA